jgi:hypothetical protein
MEKVGKLTGTIEGEEGTFEAMVYYKPKLPAIIKPLAWFIGTAHKVMKKEK